MKKSLLTLSCLALSLLTPSCISILSGGPSASQSEMMAGPQQPARDVTFSVDFSSDLEDSVFVTFMTKEDVIMAVRNEFEKSGMFGRVRYVSPEQAGAYHIHFKVIEGGMSMNTRNALGFLSGLTLMTIPVWINTDVDWSMIAMANGREVFSATSEQRLTDFDWLPCVIGSPFLNHATRKGEMSRKAVDYFIKELRENRIHEKI